MLDNKYKRWYFSIVEKAQQRSNLTEEYFEKHHIVPKSLGGSNKKENIVRVTAKEHFVCHLLLTKFTEGESKRKMSYALWMMCNAATKKHQRYLPKSKTYDISKKIRSIEFSKATKGKKKSEEAKMNMRGKRPNFIQHGCYNNAFKGYYITPWGTFESVDAAYINKTIDITRSAIRDFCLFSDKPFLSIRRNAKILTATKNSTPRDYGFWFKEK
jgi:hypothetical protein